MSWQTDLFCNITFNRQTYNSLYDVQSKIEELERCLETAKNEIRDLVVMTDPDKFHSEDPYYTVINMYRENMEVIEEYIIELYKLRLLESNWDSCHKDGLAINPPEGIHWDSAFLDGDFVKSIKYPNGNE